jgi:hypothetical protein
MGSGHIKKSTLSLPTEKKYICAYSHFVRHTEKVSVSYHW